MRKTLVLGGLVAALALSAASFAADAGEKTNGWKTISTAQNCLHNGRAVKMHSLNGEMRKTQCFALQTKKSKTGERVYQHISRDGTVIKKGRRLS